MTFPAQPPGTPAERIAGVQPQERNYYYACRDTATVVVFVHGIFSNPRFCWLNPRNGAYWPEIVYTDREIVDVSIFLAGYDTGLFVRNYGISDCASELFAGLEARQHERRAVLDHREIIFVCHSAGGVIVRHLLTQYTASFASKRVLLALYASPSRGSIYPRWLTPIFYVLEQRLGLELSVGDPILRDLDKRFKYLQSELAERGRNPRERRKTLDLHGFEAHELQPPAPFSWLSGALVVVPPESADSYFDFHAIPRSDHSTIVKPEDDKALSHQYLKRAITRLGPLSSPENDDGDPPADIVSEPVWRHQATGMLGAPWLRQVMAREGAPNYLCVDEGVLLWSRNDYGNTTLSGQLAVELKDIAGYPERLYKPSPSEIIDVLRRHEHLPGIHEWLVGQIDASRPTAADTRPDGTKAGVVALLPPTKAVSQTPALIVIEPLSFWLIRRFNRLILDQDSRPLKALRDQCLRSLLSRHEALHFAFPLALYVELVLTVADGSVVVLRKSHTLSPAARSGRSYTSGIEEGFGWPDVQGNGSDFTRIALLGLKRELDVVEAEVDQIEFFGVALEASHLNVGVLGHAHLRIRQEELRAKLRDSHDYDDSVSFIDVARMDERLADRAPRSPWHPTARLRMLLLEYRRRGQAVVDAAIRRIIDSPSPN